jgi:hypothetical protein
LRQCTSGLESVAACGCSGTTNTCDCCIHKQANSCANTCVKRGCHRIQVEDRPQAHAIAHAAAVGARRNNGRSRLATGASECSTPAARAKPIRVVRVVIGRDRHVGSGGRRIGNVAQHCALDEVEVEIPALARYVVVPGERDQHRVLAGRDTGIIVTVEVLQSRSEVCLGMVRGRAEGSARVADATLCFAATWMRSQARL